MDDQKNLVNDISQNIEDQPRLTQSVPISITDSTNNSTPSVITEVDHSNPDDLDEVWTRWKCLVCGYNYEGRAKLIKCPRCGNEDPDKFEDAD